MTVKQMNVIYRAWKEGKLPRTSKESIDNAYDFVKMANNEIKGWELRNYHRNEFEATMNLKNAVDAIFAGDYEKADNITWTFESVKLYA